MLMIRAAIVGLGWWGRTLVDSVQGKSDAISFVAGQTRSPGKIEAFSRKRDIRLRDDYEAVLSDPDIDAVVLATPHSQHAEQVTRAAAAGKHVFVEKPFALDRRSAEQALNAVSRAGIVLAVGYNRRFHPSMTELRKRVREGRLGVIGACIGEQSALTAPFLPPGAWRSTPEETPAGAMTGLGVHLLDGMIGLFGRVSEVYCLDTRRVGPHVNDTTSVLLSFQSGLTGTIFASLATAVGYRFSVYGSKGVAEISKPTLESFRFVPAPEGPPSGQLQAAPPEVIETPGFDTLNAELTAFAAAIRGEAAYPIPAEDILHGVEAFEAIVKSAETRKPVAVG
jgi:predicted dehydrogenase